MKYKRKKNQPVNKKVRNATILEYYGKTFKSKLELHCYKELKKANISFQYEEHKFELTPAFTFENVSYELYKKKGERYFGPQRPNIRAIGYTPDFIGYYKRSKKKFIIETKGNPNDAFPLRWKLFKQYLQANNCDVDLYMPRNQKQVTEVVNIIKEK